MSNGTLATKQNFNNRISELPRNRLVQWTEVAPTSGYSISPVIVSTIKCDDSLI